VSQTATPLLDSIREPSDLRKLPPEQLPALCAELRHDLLTVVCETGGHLGSTLGVIELTVASHFVFDSPNDKVVFDVGHQAYAHKILTGRRDRMPTIRKDGGISGFLKRNESPYDAFGAGHAGTSISAALGMREALWHAKAMPNRKVVAIIGDASISTGMAFEALNHAGALPRNLVVILNDNEMSIAPNVGALKAFLRRRLSGQLYNALKRDVKAVLNLLPGGENVLHLARRVDERVKSLVTPGVLFEGMGFDYIGPIDGHDVLKVVEALTLAKEVADRPVLLHALTVKGKGYAPAESHVESMHGVTPFDLATGKAKPTPKAPAPTYTAVFGDTMIKLAEADPRICAITAGMPSGTGLTKFGERFPTRFYDVGIAEQHAVTFAAGLACEGMRPVAAIYSTFLQRAFDQVVHDVCIQNLPVTFCLDRGGLAGADGATHHGWGDLTWMRSIPNMVVMAPKDENEMRRMMKTALEHAGPAMVRYPRGEGEGVVLEDVIEPLPIGKGEIVFGDLAKAKIGIAAIGAMVGPAVRAAATLAAEGIDVCVVNARFAKPLDEELLTKLASLPGGLVTVEENTIKGGFGSAVLELCQERGSFPARMERLGIPDEFIHHGSPAKLRAACGIDADSIAAAARRLAAITPMRRAAERA
jgi:1-deoxy-D-xylulose-5-phosphate synthase